MRLSGLIIAGIGAMLCACSGKSDKQKPQMELRQQTVEKTDSMAYGTCGEGTAMHTVELIGADGNSRSYTIDGGESGAAGTVLGGLNVGDSLAIMSRHDVDGMPMADIVVNITSLTGRWVSLGQTLTLYKEGKALTKAKEAKTVVNWRLCNGQLLIGKDTFDISTLGHDSLYLRQGATVTGYRKMPE